MFRTSKPGLRAARIASLLLATLLIAAHGTPLEAKGVTKLLKESTFTVQTWIPGFDDDEPVFTCAPISTPGLMQTKSSNHARFRKLSDDENGCGVRLRMLPWNFQSIRVDGDELFLPII